MRRRRIHSPDEHLPDRDGRNPEKEREGKKQADRFCPWGLAEDLKKEEEAEMGATGR